MFSTDQIRSRVREMPFRPFQVVTTAGDIHEVRHPELIMVGVGDVVIGIPSPNNPNAYERLTRVSLFHIVELRDFPVESTATQNGTA